MNTANFITVEDLNTLKWDTANKWLTKYTNNDEWGIQGLLESPSFWAWWNNQWNLTDKAFAAEYSAYLKLVDAQSATMLKGFYIEAHSPEGLNLRLGESVLNEAYALLIGKMWDETQTKTAKH